MRRPDWHNFDTLWVEICCRTALIAASFGLAIWMMR